MMEFQQDEFFSSILFQSLGYTPQIKKYQFVGGGCINNTIRLDTEEAIFFLKWNEFVEEDMFYAESRGLELMRNSNTVHVPRPIHNGELHGKKYLLMEFLETSYHQKDYWEKLGRSLAQMHQHTSQMHGLDFNNYIGKLPQRNIDRTDRWIDFFIDHRLEVQLGLAIYNHLVSTTFVENFRSLYSVLPDILHDDEPALLHGDLWNGNVMGGPDGYAWLIDPAVYYGSREADLAMTRMFGGFDQQFYNAYHEIWPKDGKEEERYEIYNLYNIMVHVNLFGKSYLNAALRTIKRFT